MLYYCICDSDMDANLSQLVQRLELVTNRLENVAGQSSVSPTHSQPKMDSGEIFCCFLCINVSFVIVVIYYFPR